MTERDFDPHWLHGHVTRDGRPARVICTDKCDLEGKAVIALVEEGDDEALLSYYPDGRFLEFAKVCADLFNAPAPRQLEPGDLVELEDGRRALVEVRRTVGGMCAHAHTADGETVYYPNTSGVAARGCDGDLSVKRIILKHNEEPGQ